MDLLQTQVLEYGAFSVRIAEVDVPKFPAILRAITPSRVTSMQAALARVRSRFGYSSIAKNELRLASAQSEKPPDYLQKLAKQSNQEEDALGTMMRILLHRSAMRGM